MKRAGFPWDGAGIGKCAVPGIATLLSGTRAGAHATQESGDPGESSRLEAGATMAWITGLEFPGVFSEQTIIPP